ncbi:MAG: hypothetical protein IJM03_11635 [Treponema sp.]|nr:hypothetical protein [Treponema sp.]
MKLSIKKLLNNDSVIEWCGIFILIDIIFLVLNLGFGITVSKTKVYHERNYYIANFEVAIILISLLVASIRFYWLKKKISCGTQVTAIVKNLLEKKSFWKTNADLFLKLSFEMDGANFEKEVPVKFSSDLKKILEKGSTKILVKDPGAEKIVLLELICDLDF